MHLLLSPLEARETHSAWSIYNLSEDLKSYLTAGTAKPTFQAETDRCVAKLPQNVKNAKTLQDYFNQHTANKYSGKGFVNKAETAE